MFNKMKIFLKNKYGHGLDDDANIFQKISFYIIERPLCILRQLTIPQLEDDTWNRKWVCMTPPCGFIFFLLATEMINIYSI